MPHDKDLKRLVRTRMTKTGESYTTARAHITKSKATKAAAPSAAAAPESEPPAAAHVIEPPAPARATETDNAGVAGMSDDKVAAKTGRSWAAWVQVLDEEGAERLPHGEIARLVNGKYEVEGWWAQTVTVGYERIKGLRERGQRRSGAYEVSKSKTVHVPVGELFDACADDAVRRSWLTGVNPRLTTATKPRSLRLRWPDGTLVAFWFTEKSADRSTLAVQHTKLPDKRAAEQMKQFWTARLDSLGRLLSSR